MCGIVYAKNLKDNTPVNETIKALYLSQKERGYQGFGMVGLTKNSFQYFKSEDEKSIFKLLNEQTYDEILYHHRFPTSTENTTKTAHPFKIQLFDKIYYFVHNGIISNPTKLKAEHDINEISMPYESYNPKVGTFNDSEALAYNFVLAINNQPQQTTPTGSASIICLQTDKDNRAERLYFYTNGDNPLKMYKDDNIFILSSETGESNIKIKKLFYYDYKDKKIKEQKTTFKVNSYQYQTGSKFANWTDYQFDDYKYPQTFHTPTTTPDNYDNLLSKAEMLTNKITSLEQEYYKLSAKDEADKKLLKIEYQLDNYQDKLDDINAELLGYNY